VLAWGTAALADLDQATKLLADKGVDIASSPVNYHELGMREDFRMDLRNSPTMSALESQMRQRSAAAEGKDEELELTEPYKQPVGGAVSVGGGALDLCPDSRDVAGSAASRTLGVPVDTQLPLLHSVLQEVCNPPPEDASTKMGNWGRWNFGGAGMSRGMAPLVNAIRMVTFERIYIDACIY
jgi:hypothetical protein